MFLFHRTVIDDVLFFLCQILERHVRTHAHRPADIGHQRPHQRVPRRHRSFVDAQVFVGHQRLHIDGAHDTGPAAALAGTGRIECQFFRTRTVKVLAAFRTDHLFHGRHRKGRLHIVAVGTAVRSQPGKHQAQGIEQLATRTEGGTDARNARTLMQSQGSRYIQNFIDVCPGCLGHPSSGISR